jgi:chlorite dismutase
MTTPASSPAPHGGPPAAAGQRQIVNFAFYKLDPAFRRLDAEARDIARREFVAAAAPPAGMICLSYSTVGTRADTDLLLWRIAPGTDAIQTHQAVLNRTRLAGYLTQPWSFLSMTKRSIYVDGLDPFHAPESRAVIVPGKRKFLFVYPFVKTRQWYLLPLEERQKIMDEHIRVGNEYPTVKLNTTYSFGLDDQDFVVAFETNEPRDFLDLVMRLRETASSLYTVRDTPIFTCVQMPLDEVLGQMF